MINSSSEDVFDALELVARSPQPLTLAAIARAKSIPLSTAFRIVSTLQNAGFIQTSGPSKGYILGGASHQLAQALFSRFKIRRASYPFLQQLALITGETCCLSVPIGWYCVRIFSARGTNEVVLSPPLGEIAPLSGSLAGKVMLSFQPPHRLTAYRNWAERTLSLTLTNAVLTELAASKKRGYLYDGGKERAAKRPVAFPILRGEDCIASISIEGPVFDPRSTSGKDLEQWKDICGRVGALVRQEPALFISPFAHIDPDDISLPISSES